MSQLNLLTQAAETNTSTVKNLYTAKKPSSKKSLDFSSIIGQSTAVSMLKGAIASNQIAPAYLFAGPDGVGKTLTANTFISQLLSTNINHPDLLWIEPTHIYQGEQIKESEIADSEVKRKSPPQIRIEQTREVISFLACSSVLTSYKVVAIQNADCINQSAANALLKTLEEPTNGTIILLSSQPQKLLPTITSRCQKIPFRRLNSTEMVEVLKKDQEKILNNSVILDLAAGSPGKAIADYEQLQVIPATLLEKLSVIQKDALSAIKLAKEIEASLEFHQQLWLLDYLQVLFWKQHNKVEISKIEQAKTALLKLASCRLVWDILLLP